MTFDPMYGRSENLKIPIVGPKIKVAKSIWCDLSKLVREGQKANEKRFSLIRPTGFEKKPKIPENKAFPEYGIFR